MSFAFAAAVFIAGSAWAGDAPARPTSPTAIAAVPTSPTAVAVSPTTPGVASDPVAIKWLRALEERHRDHRRAWGEFRQTKKDTVFLEEIAASGRFYYERPSQFRCDYDTPDPSTNTVVGDVATVYLPEFKQATRYRLSREGSGISDVNQILLAFGIETDKILKYFTVTSDPATSANIVRLTFEPKARREERPFERFVLDLSKPDLTPKRFLIVGGEDDQTSVAITKIVWNDPAMRSDIFQLKFPRDVEIIEKEE